MFLGQEATLPAAVLVGARLKVMSSFEFRSQRLQCGYVAVDLVSQAIGVYFFLLFVFENEVFRNL